MQCVESKMVQALVLASQIMWVIHMKVVVQNVCSTQTVHLIVHVYETNVKIPVQERVARMQTVKLWITYHLALVVQAILEIHSDSATTYHLNVRSYNNNIFILLHTFVDTVYYIMFMWKNHLTIIHICFLFFFFSCKARTRRSLCTISMWTKQSVSKCEWTSSMLLPTFLYRQSTRLSTRVCCELRMCTEQSMYEPEMCGSMSRNMWTKCTLWSDQSQSNM
jgi:hypothetical protein